MFHRLRRVLLSRPAKTWPDALSHSYISYHYTILLEYKNLRMLPSLVHIISVCFAKDLDNLPKSVFFDTIER